MTENALTDKNFAHSASAPWVDLRGGGQALGGSYVYEGRELQTDWHRHDVHQIEYAIGGVVEVATAAGTYLLPPQQAAWLPAGLPHTATMNAGVKTIAVMFDASLVLNAGNRARILAVSPLIREMMAYALRWPIHRPISDQVSDDFFRTLAHLVSDAIDHEAPLTLPTSEHPTVQAAMAYTKENLATATIAATAQTVAVSPRTLRRLFQEETGITWREYLLHARLLRALALLSTKGRSVQSVAHAVGFDSVSSFSRSFTQFCGESPRTYRTRVTTNWASAAI